MSPKDELLKDLDRIELLRLVKSVSKTPVDEKTSKRDLIKIVKSSLSIEETKQKVEEIESTLRAKHWARNEAFIGGIGQVFLTVWGFTGALMYIGLSFFFPSVVGATPIQTLSFWSMIVAAFFLIFAVFDIGSMLIIRRRLNRNRMGIIAASTALVTSVVGILYYMFDYIGLTYDINYSPYGYYYTTINALGIAIPFVYNLLLAIAMILTGVFFFFHRGCFSNMELSIVAGLLYVLAGAFQLSYSQSSVFSFSYAFISYVFVVSSPLFIVAGVVGTSCFFATR